MGHTFGLPPENGDALDSSWTEKQVLIESVRQLYARGGVGQITVVICSTLVTVVLWRTVPHRIVLGWLSAHLVLVALRFVLFRFFRTRARVAEDALHWGLLYTSAAALGGLLWGVSAFLFQDISLQEQTFLAFVLGGMVAGAAPSHAPYPPAFVAFALPTLVPIAVRFAAGGDQLQLAMSALMVLFGVATGLFSRIEGRALADSTRLHLKNEKLVETLASAQADLSRSNIELEQRVADRTGELERVLRDRIEMERKLAHAGLLAGVGRLAAAVAHEINNPLSCVIGNMGFVRTWVAQRAGPKSDPDGVLEAAQEAIEGGVRVRDIVRELEFLARPEPIGTGPVDLHAVLRSCVERAGKIMGIELPVAMDLKNAIPLVMGSSERLDHVFTNLLVNTYDASLEINPVASRIEMRTRWQSEDDCVLVEITDRERLMSPEDLDKAFEPFVSARHGANRSGLGLATCRAIVTGLGGKISVRSESGDGTTFTISLPADRSFRLPAP